MSALWALPLVVFAAGAVALAVVTRRLATEAAELRRDADGLAALVDAAAAAQVEAADLTRRGVEVGELQARLRSVRSVRGLPVPRRPSSAPTPSTPPTDR